MFLRILFLREMMNINLENVMFSERKVLLEATVKVT